MVILTPAGYPFSVVSLTFPSWPATPALCARHSEVTPRETPTETSLVVWSHQNKSGAGVARGRKSRRRRKKGECLRLRPSCSHSSPHTTGGPGAVQREEQAYRVIATPEALGLLLASFAFGPRKKLEHTRLAVQVSALSDNNGKRLHRQQSCADEVPLCVIMNGAGGAGRQRGARVEAA